MSQDYTCKVYGVYEPSPKDRLFYYSGEIKELHGEPSGQTVSHFDELNFCPLCGIELLGTVFKRRVYE